MPYLGPERRIHRIFLTRNTEYHLRDWTCVAVRDRHSGQWLSEHFAHGRAVAGSLSVSDGGAISASERLPSVGESMYFETHTRDLVTSSIIAVERPQRDVVAQYA